ncbi:FkbM family methyltransferase [Candidatus Woesearchaeota archaeon]|nr:FkbM family methyltransferase [Candidatus Woesearchaeota archaeon]
MASGLVNRVRGAVKYILERHPYTICLAEFMIKLPVLLPHDNEYYGFCRLSDKKKGLFLDIGANDGRSILSFHKLRKDWDIFSVEASSIHKKRLEKIKSKIPNLTYVIKAVGKERGKRLKLYTPVYGFYAMHTAAGTSLETVKKRMMWHFGKRIANNFRYKETECETIMIDDLKLSPDIIKIDIEGAELDALLGCRKTIKKYSPYFMIEYNESNFKDIWRFLSKRGYELFGFDPKKMKFEAFSKDRFRNCYFMPKFRI